MLKKKQLQLSEEECSVNMARWLEERGVIFRKQFDFNFQTQPFGCVL